ncbi:LamG-like jellyroll fold domain-containing protein [Flavobacterium tegetincola]|uniref:RCC1 domain-containing protein n=1 Tax=Flavobacterium tegetincola TaxID=150172 RepID=UPI0004135EEB|nr:LamG-like jellyroll fold domain-containing protein [Flavobacterium tegetincola]
MKIKNYLFLLVTLFSTVTSFSQMVDQDHLVGWSSLDDAVTFGQSFTPGLSGRLSQFDFGYYNAGAYNYHCELKIYSGTGTSGTLLKTQPFLISQNVPTGNVGITINNGPVVVAGATYSAVITVISGGPPNGKMRYTFKENIPHYMTGIVPDSYLGGELLFNTSSLTKDLIFRTYVTPTSATHLNFDGVNDYVTLSNESSFDFTNQMTVEFWMNSNTTPAQWDALVTKGDDSWRIALTGDGKINFAVGGTSFGSVTSNASVIDGNWHHVAFTFNGSTAIIYIDGVQDSSASGTGSINNSAYNVALGENLQATGRNYTGSMDEVRIWNIARSASEISAAKNCELSGSESGLVAYYNFNQGMGYVDNTSITSLIDASSNSNNGTFNGFAMNGFTSNFLTTDGIYAPSLPTLSAPVIFSQTNAASVVSASSGSLLWYTTATGGTSSTTPPTLDFSGNGSASYWISEINGRGCETDRIELVVVNAAAIPASPTALAIQLYKGDGTLANLTATGTNLEWFSTSIGGTALDLSTVLVDNTTYYVSQSPQGVRSPRISVKAKKISASTQVFCSTTSVADLIATPSTSATAKWFSNTTNSTPLTNSDAVNTGSLYVEQSIASATTSIGTGFLKPEGIFVDASGSVYVADTNNFAVKKMDSNGIETLVIGDIRPLDVTVDVLGNIYVFDSTLKAIVKMDSQGNNRKLIYEFGGAPIESNPSYPRVFSDQLGNIYFYYYYNIKKMDSNGGNVQQILSTINGIRAMALDHLGNIYVVSGDELQKVNLATGNVSVLASNFYGVRNLRIDRLGTIYYTHNGNLKSINNDGSSMQVVATNIAGNPTGLSIDASGSIYVTTYNTTASEVKKYNPNFTSNRVAIAMSIESVAVPTFTAPVYIQGATATALTATSTGTGLLWYTVATGGTGSTTAPTPSTDTVGVTSYWVSSTSVGGCESARAEMVVTVTLPATHLSFDGTNDFVNIGSVISAGASYTKEAMIKPNAITGNYNILSSAGDVFWISDNQIRAGHTSNFSHVLAPATVLLNAWNHVAVTYDAPTTTMKLYINGALVSTNTNVQAATGNTMQIGAYASVVPFNGSMDDVRIWNVARTQAQLNGYRVCELQGNEFGLIAYYKFNQGTGGVSNTGLTSLINSVSGGANGTLHNFTLDGASSNWLAGSPIVSGVVIPSVPTVTSPVSYFQNNTASVLTATADGTGLLWYTVATGGTGSTTAPKPSTATVGTISYWVSSTNANGCESERAEIIVSVNEFTTPGCWKQISFGAEHTIAIAENGTLWGWGSNSYFQFGLGSGYGTNSSLPVQIGTANNWKSISANENMTMAITTSGTLWTFGYSSGNGSMGNGTMTNPLYPMQVGTASDWESVSVGKTHCLGVKSTGTLWSWGSGFNGALGHGLGLTSTLNYVPTQIGTATNWKAVSAGDNLSLALTTSGTLWVWGSSSDGRLGLGNSSNVNEPVQIGTDTDWKTIDAGSDFALAVKTSGTLWAWGSNQFGKLGLGHTNSVNIPTQVGTATDWKEVSTGLFHTMAITNSGTLWSWGYNNYGQLGTANSTNQNAPVQVGNNTNWDSLSTNVFSSGAVTSAGTLFTWGYNSSRQLGLGNTVNKNVPTGVNCPTCATEDVATPTIVTPVIIVQGSIPIALTAVSGSTDLLWFTDATDGAGSTTAPLPSTTNPNITSYWVSSTNASGCKSARVEIRVEVTPSVEANCWKQISMSKTHTLAIAQNGTLWAWGSNSSGSLGIGNLVNSVIPVQVGINNNWAFISAGNNFSTAITTSGTLWGWGDNSDMQLGLADSNNRNIPVQIGSATDWNFISAGGEYCIAIKTSGTLWSWGEGSFVLGQGSVFQISTPTQIGTATHWKTVSASQGHVMAITTSGTLWAWGYNDNGLYLGLGEWIDSKNIPTQVGTASNWSMVSTADSHTLALTTSGTLWAWGRNADGALGIPSIYEAKVPMQVGTETHWQSISSGNDFSIAVTTSGTLWTWGYNYFGQLGQGNIKSKVEPTQVGTATHWKNIYTGYRSSAAVTNAGTLNVWGYNQDGVLGLGNTVQRNVPNGLDCPLDAIALPPTAISLQIFAGDDKTLADLEVVGDNIKFYDTAAAGTEIVLTTLLTDGATYYASQTQDNVESTVRVAITIHKISESAQIFCDAATLEYLITTPSAGATVNWFTTATGSTILTNTDALVTGTYYVEQSAPLSNRVAVNVVVNPLTTPTFEPVVAICAGETLDALPTTSEEDVTGTWSPELDNSATTTYTFTPTEGQCATTTTLEIVVNELPVITANDTETKCAFESIVLTPLINTSNTNGFVDYYAGENWIQSAGNSNGSITFNDSDLTMLSSSNFNYVLSNSSPGFNLAKLALPYNATLSFNWNYTTTDAASTAYPQFYLNGVLINFSGYNFNDSEQNGTFNISLQAGDEFGLNMYTVDNRDQQAEVVISNFQVTPDILYQWIASNGGEIEGASDELSLEIEMDGTYTLTVINGNGCSASKSIAVTVNETPVPLAEAQTFCGSTTVAQLEAVGENLIWYNNDFDVVESTSTLASGTYFVSQTLNGCKSEPKEVLVTIKEIPSAPTVPNQVYCSSTVVANLQGSGNMLKWYLAPTGGNVLVHTANVTSNTYYVSQTVNGCESERTSVQIFVGSEVIVEVISQTNVSCNGFSNGSASVEVSGGTQPYTYEWSDGSTSATLSGVSAGTYTLRVADANGCGSIGFSSFNASVTITEPAVVQAPTAQSQIFISGATVADLMATGENLTWYDALDTMNSLVTTTVLTSNTYYVSQTVSGCESSRTAVTVTVSNGSCITPTLANVTSAAACVGSTLEIILSGLIPNASGTATFKVGNAQAQTQEGTSDANGTFSFSVPALAEFNGLVVEITKLSSYQGCETIFTDKKVTLVITPQPTLTAVTAAPVCAGSKTFIVLSGLLPNAAGTAFYKIGNGPILNFSGTTTPQGTFSFQTPVLNLAANGLVVEITKMSTVSGCETNFTNKKVTLVVTPKPTLTSVTAAPVCAGSTTNIVLSGLLPNAAGTAFYKLNNGPILSVSGTASATGTFNFQTPILTVASNGVVVEITKIVNSNGCQTNFINKKVTLIINAKPTLSAITAAPVCQGNATNIVLSGLVLNAKNTATYKVGNQPLQTQAGISTATGIFSFQTPVLNLSNNGLVVEITKIVNSNGCETNFTNKKVTLVVEKCMMASNQSFVEKNDDADSGTNSIEINDSRVVNVITIYPNPTKDVFTIISSLEVKSVELLNMQGQKVLWSTQNQINVSSLPTGTYMIRITDSKDHVTVKKVIKD